MAGRPGKSDLNKLRAKTWFNFVSKAAGEVSAYRLDQIFGGGENVWSRYRRGDRVPGGGVLNDVEEKFKGSKRIFERGPGGLFVLKEAQSLREALEVLRAEAAEALDNERGHKFLPNGSLPVDVLDLFPIKVSASDFTELYIEIDNLTIPDLTAFDLSIVYIYRRFLDFNFHYQFPIFKKLVDGPGRMFSEKLDELGLDPALVFRVFPEIIVFPIANEIPELCSFKLRKSLSPSCHPESLKLIEMEGVGSK